MSKTIFHTYDIFNSTDQKINIEYFDFCHKKALRCGLSCVCIDMESRVPKLKLTGTKWEFIKYYFLTLTKCECKWKGIKRLLSFVLERS